MAEDHYDECEIDFSGSCTCHQVDLIEETYRTEPPDMVAREWGS